ncbi:MAG: patatin-like phospholipase family protein [Bacteroidales bacterium]|nr:patatin-like phospholipase family protein [Bacteroidales bacterium]
MHIRKSPTLVLFWIILGGFVTNSFLSRFGAGSLFLTPEYLDKIDYLSFFLMGLATGAFIIAFNISSYLINAYKFPFIATLSRPFLKYTLNNFIFPLSYVLLFIYYSIKAQINNEFIPDWEIFYNIISFLFGMSFFIFLALTYFFTTNKDVYKMYKLPRENKKVKKIIRPVKVILQKDMEWKMVNSPREEGKWRIATYLKGPFKIRKTRDFTHYTSDMIHRVLQQNHTNAGFFATGIMAIIMFLAYYMDNPIVIIPAGASIILAFTLFILLYSALHAVFKDWSFLAIIILIVGYNFASTCFFSEYINSAYGLNYSYAGSKKVLEVNYTDSIHLADHDSTLVILENWKKKNEDVYKSGKKPKLVFINTSGGGLKAAIWTYYVLGYADSLSGGKLLKQSQLITGASGGMIGAAYLRELYLQKLEGKIDNYYDQKYLRGISKDILNPIIFSLVLKDWFIKIKKFEYNGYLYYKDRAYALEQKLNRNTGWVLDKPLKDYKEPEKKAQIPMIIIAPTIVNNGRRLLISPNNISYLFANAKASSVSKYPNSNVEFLRAYDVFGAENLRFTTALRMAATFPYVSPMISLPGEPTLNIMDAGLTDNYGLSTSLRFLYEFQEWIGKNTSGVIFVQITADNEDAFVEGKGLLSRLLQPVGNVYSNMFNIQNVQNENLIEFSSNWLRNHATFIHFSLKSRSNHISLSWHLNSREKLILFNAINRVDNKNSINQLVKLLD